MKMRFDTCSISIVLNVLFFLLLWFRRIADCNVMIWQHFKFKLYEVFKGNKGNHNLSSWIFF